MTSIERKLLEKREKNLRLKKLADKHILRLKEKLQEEVENHYYADSWDQSAQISRRIDELDKKIDFLSKLKQKLICGVKLTLSECTIFKKICMNKWCRLNDII